MKSLTKGCFSTQFHHSQKFSGNFELNEVEVGQRVSDLRQLLDVSYPMENGIIRNWDDMELLWNHTFGEGMVILLYILCIKQISYTRYRRCHIGSTGVV